MTTVPMAQVPHSAVPRHQCLVYSGSPNRQLAGLALHIRKKLAANFRCLYLHNPDMVTGIRAYLTSSGLDVSAAIVQGRLILSSDQSHLVNDAFDHHRMLVLLKDTHDRALADGYAGLFATGDMAWEFGPAADYSKLADYERALDAFFHVHPTMHGVCQYHEDVMPGEAVEVAHIVHPGIYVDETLSRSNPRYVPV